eukprot:GHVL01028184.1.p1 GENE.GHVL01028184.1~~GHVL01028184.1.p1  ORF type:complete len:843 (-),score=145.46 GHVL01028184.1:1909-4404(-)
MRAGRIDGCSKNISAPLSPIDSAISWLTEIGYENTAQTLKSENSETTPSFPTSEVRSACKTFLDRLDNYLEFSDTRKPPVHVKSDIQDILDDTETMLRHLMSSPKILNDDDLRKCIKKLHFTPSYLKRHWGFDTTLTQPEFGESLKSVTDVTEAVKASYWVPADTDAPSSAPVVVLNSKAKPQRSAHYTPVIRRSKGLPKLDDGDEYWDDEDPGYRVHEIYEYDLMDFIQQKLRYAHYEAFNWQRKAVGFPPVAIEDFTLIQEILAAGRTDAATPPTEAEPKLVVSPMSSPAPGVADVGPALSPPKVDSSPPETAAPPEASPEIRRDPSPSFGEKSESGYSPIACVTTHDKPERAGRAFTESFLQDELLNESKNEEKCGRKPSPVEECPQEIIPGGMQYSNIIAFSSLLPPPPMISFHPITQAPILTSCEDVKKDEIRFNESYSFFHSEQRRARKICQKQRNSRVNWPPSGNGCYPVTFDDAVIDSMALSVIFEREKTGFEDTKELNTEEGAVIAGRYQVMRYLGAAAFSKAVSALGRHVCLKIIKNEKDYIDQSLDEVIILRHLNSNCPDVDRKNLLAYFDSFYYKEHLIIVSELLKQNLYEFSKFNRESGDEPYFTLGRLQRVSRAILQAVEYVHSLGLMHCDLKPENILIKSASRCEIKVIDFGSSCFDHDQLNGYVQSRSYRAPEVILGLPYDQKVDIWSLGCIVAELWTGYVLFQNDSVQGLLARVTGIMGNFPFFMLNRGRLSPHYFTGDNQLYIEVPGEVCPQSGRRLQVLVPKSATLKQRLRTDDDDFVDFVKNLLLIDPSLRPSAREALNHHWLKKPYPDSS